MQFNREQHMELLTKSVLRAINEHEEEVMIFIPGCNSYVLDQDGLAAAIRRGLEAA